MTVKKAVPANGDGVIVDLLNELIHRTGARSARTVNKLC